MKFSVVVFAALEQIISITIDFILIILFISYKLKSNACQKPERLNLNTYICTNPLTMNMSFSVQWCFILVSIFKSNTQHVEMSLTECAFLSYSNNNIDYLKIDRLYFKINKIILESCSALYSLYYEDFAYEEVSPSFVIFDTSNL